MWLILLPNHMWFAGFTKHDCEVIRKHYPQFTDETIKIVQVKDEWAGIQREHRHYKQELFLKGELK